MARRRTPAAEPGPAQPAAETAAPAIGPRSAPPPATPRRSPTLWPVLALAALALGLAGGYLLTREGGPLSNSRVPELEDHITALQTRLTAAEAEIKTLSKTLETVPSNTALNALSARVDVLDTSDADASAARDQLRADLEELARRPPPVVDNALSEQAVAAYERELQAMRQMLETELTRIRDESEAATQKATEAAQAGASAESLAALAEIVGALETGGAFGPALDQLEAVDPGLPTAAIRPYQDGIAPLPDLQRRFPEAAREALTADTAAANQGGVTGFLRAQLGMRSLSPQEGDGADAILSRAEAALRQGNLKAALDETASLTGPAADAMSGWRTDAQARLDAMAAYAALEAQVRN